MNRSDQIVASVYQFSVPIPEEVTLAFASDLHCCEAQPVLEAMRAFSPDGVLVGGDFIHNHARFQQGFDFLRLSAKEYPTFCVIGNHEHRYLGDLTGDIRSTGVTLLDNEWREFRGMFIGGLTSALREQRVPQRYLKKQVPDLEFLNRFSAQSGYKVLICHHPEYYAPYIRPRQINLTLSGHAHGGQWRAFNRGFYAPGQGFFPKYTGGLYDGRLVVGRGLGNPHSIPRINNAPELVILHLGPNFKSSL